MYTLLLVDDEEEVIEVIAKKVKWEELGFEVIGKFLKSLTNNSGE